MGPPSILVLPPVPGLPPVGTAPPVPGPASVCTAPPVPVVPPVFAPPPAPPVETPPAPPTALLPSMPVFGPSTAPSFFVGALLSPHPATASIAIAAQVSHVRDVGKVQPSLLEFILFPSKTVQNRNNHPN
jgi:hypothetical protein